jgi:hypothetical protein
MALDAGKFEQWQPNLLALLNEPKLARFARWRMGLGRHIAPGEEVLSISPHQIIVPARGGLRTVFLPQPALQRSLYRGFRPVFWGMHAYDWLLPDRVSQRWVRSLIRPMRPVFEGFGLSTLTGYSQAGGGGGNVTCDGVAGYYLSNPGDAFANVLGHAGNDHSATSAIIYGQLGSGNGSSGLYTNLYRAFASFNTAALGSSATISAAAVSLYGTSKASGLGTCALDLVGSTQAAANNIANSDYGAAGASLFGSIAYASFGTSGYNQISLNSTGIAAISKTGVTLLAFLLDWDFTATFGGTWGTTQTTNLIAYSADQGASYAPKLVVTYTVPTLAMRRELSGLGTRMGSRQVQG